MSMSILVFVLLLHSYTFKASEVSSRRPLRPNVPRCNYILDSNDTKGGQNAWSVSDTAREYLPSNGSNIAHFACQCNPQSSPVFRGSLSSLLSDPLSTIPLLHLVNSNVTIFVELTGCSRIKLSLDVTELLFQRATSSTNIDFVLKISASKKVQISKAKLSSNQSCILVFEDIPGRVSVNGRIECIGCNHPSEEQRAKKVPDTMLAFFVQSVSTFAIEDSLVNAPLRLTARDVENVMIASSVFTTIPWPGIYIYNASKITIHRNIFQSVAPRSLVFKNGQALEVIQNGLDVTSALDVSQFASLSIYCNRPTSTKLPLNCDHNSEEEAEFSEVDHDQWRTLISFLTIGFGPFWLFMLIGAVASVALYKFKLGVNEPDIGYNRSKESTGLQLHLQSIDDARTLSLEKNEESPKENNANDVFCTSCCPRFVSHQVSDTADLGDEYSNSSRLHLAGGNDHPNYAKVPHFPDTDGSSVGSYPIPHSPYMQQLERLSLSNYASGVANQSPSILHATPIGFDLWQRHSNGITHIDSEGDTSDTFNANQSSPASDENYLSISAVAGPTTKQFCHPSSNYAYKKEPPIPRNKPAWHYPSGTDIVKYS